MAQIIFKLDDDVHSSFKAACALKNTTMTDQLLRWVENFAALDKIVKIPYEEYDPRDMREIQPAHQYTQTFEIFIRPEVAEFLRQYPEHVVPCTHAFMREAAKRHRLTMEGFKEYFDKEV